MHHVHHGHAHDAHDHGHGHAPKGDPRKALAWALALNGGYLVVELVVGTWSGSLALLSDAAHMASDVGALLLALGAAQLALAPSGPGRTFGWRRAEVLGGFTNGVLLLVVCAWIVWEAASRALEGPPELPGLPMLVVAFVGLLINLGAAFALWREGHDDLNVRGAMAHMLADAVGSVGAMVAGGLVMLGYPLADPVVSVLVALLVVWGTFGLLRLTAQVLLQLPPSGFDVGKLRGRMTEVAGVGSVHDLHVWTLDGRSPILTAHVVLADGGDALQVRSALEHVLEHDFGVPHATIQVEAGGSCLVPENCGG
jgi:cobalt-zinc-cadmium efflux system protein